MKKLLLLFISLTFFNTFFCSCSEDKYEIANKNSLVQATSDGPIAMAEAKLGKLVKKDLVFKDLDGTSSFTMRIAAKTKGEIDKYLLENSLKFTTFNKEKYDLNKQQLNATKLIVNESKMISQNNQYNPEEIVENVALELVKKELAYSKVAFRLEMTVNKIVSKNAKKQDEYDDGYYFRTCPFKWAEYSQVETTSQFGVIGYSGGYANDPILDEGRWGIYQKRGALGGWGNFFNIGKPYPGQLYGYNVDSPRWVRCGMKPSSNRYYFKVNFYSFEEDKYHSSEN